MKKNILIILNLAFVMLLICSCKKFVEVPSPQNQIITQVAFADDKTAIATLNGIYAKMMSSPNLFASSSISFFPALSADELYYFSASTRDGFLRNSLNENNDTELNAYLWSPAYNYIYSANSCVEGAAASTTLTDSVRNMVTGEALFIRSFCYFQLANLFGDVPLILTTDYEVNKTTERTPSEKVFKQIEDDLIKAEQLLSETYPSANRARPNRTTVKALLAKVYLYKKDWKGVVKYCDPVISDSRYSLTDDLTKVFLSTSNEVLWQLAPVTPNLNTYVGNIIIPASASAAPTYLITEQLLNAFESGDKRKTSWVQMRTYQGRTLYYPYKYRIKTGSTVTEYNMVFRLAEIYLMRAEAEAQMKDIAHAVQDINQLRGRAGLTAISASITQPDLLAAIMNERRIELFSEWGNRWFDLKRTELATTVLSLIKPQWKSTAVLYPIPYSQITKNPKLTQNEGY